MFRYFTDLVHRDHFLGTLLVSTVKSTHCKLLAGDSERKIERVPPYIIENSIGLLLMEWIIFVRELLGNYVCEPLF